MRSNCHLEWIFCFTKVSLKLTGSLDDPGMTFAKIKLMRKSDHNIVSIDLSVPPINPPLENEKVS